jgi:hypothetical protein
MTRLAISALALLAALPDGLANKEADALARKIADAHARDFRCRKDTAVVLGEKGPGFSEAVDFGE